MQSGEISVIMKITFKCKFMFSVMRFERLNVVKSIVINNVFTINIYYFKHILLHYTKPITSQIFPNVLNGKFIRKMDFQLNINV